MLQQVDGAIDDDAGRIRPAEAAGGLRHRGAAPGVCCQREDPFGEVRAGHLRLLEQLGRAGRGQHFGVLALVIVDRILELAGS